MTDLEEQQAELAEIDRRIMHAEAKLAAARARLADLEAQRERFLAAWTAAFQRRRREAEQERAAEFARLIAVDCPLCRAGTGHRCRMVNGRPMGGNVHSERKRAAAELDNGRTIGA